jgi:acyl-CoA synthetase (AMP-forming)/AMP-acid ligase II
MFHLAALASCLAQTIAGGTHVIVGAFDPEAVLRTIEERDVTHSLLVPTMIQMLLAHPGFADHDLSSLRRVVYGGSPITLGVLERAQELLPGVALSQAYGMTELAPVATLLGSADHAAKRKLTSGGRPAPHVEIRIAGADDEPLAPGEVGEILVRGPNLMSGYWERPEETREALRGGWMHTGDGGYLDEDGYLFVVDRIKDMIVTGGENVYSAEVETALSLHPAVAACAIIGVPDDRWGERVHAVVVLTADADPTSDELRAHVRERIAGYKVPRTIDFADALPLSAAGKVLKRELREAYAARAAS